MHASEWHLGGADQIQIVLRHTVDLMLVGREEARVDHHLFADQHRRHYGVEAPSDELAQRPLHERELDLHGGSGDVGKPRTAYRRPELVIHPADVATEVGMIHWRRIRRTANGGDNSALVLATIGNRLVGRNRKLQRARHQLRVERGVLGFGLAKFCFDRTCGLDLCRALIGRCLPDLLRNGV